jgi:hypothetical protein
LHDRDAGPIIWRMKSSLLTRLQRNGVSYLLSGLILILGIPLYQGLVLAEQGYGASLNNGGHTEAYLAWIGNHWPTFLLYRILLIAAFALIMSLPFSLYRIIVAQELMEQQESDEEQDEIEALDEETEDEEKKSADALPDEEKESDDVLPEHAWRGKGFAVLAVWFGTAGIGLYVVGSLISTIYLLISSQGAQANGQLPDSFNTLTNVFSVTSNTVGIGLLALTTLLFGAMIARGGRNLWPGMWVAFGYVGIAVTALLSGSAVGIANAPGEGQAPLTTPAIFLLGLWIGWLGTMLMRLKPEK